MSVYKRRDYSKALKPRQIAAAIAADLAAAPDVAAAALGIRAPFEVQRAPAGVEPAASLVFQIPEDELTDSDVKDEQMVRDLATKKGYVKIHTDCRNWVRLKPTEAMDKATRVAFEPLWRLHFARFNGVEAAGMSYTDIGFRAICWAMRAEMPELRNAAVGVQSIRMVHLSTAIFSCQHTKESRTNWPAYNQWAEYKRTVAALVTTLFTGSQVQRAALLAKLDDPAFAFDPVDGSVLDQYDSLHLPRALVDQQREQERIAEARRKAGKGDGARTETSDEASGYIWRNTSDALVDHLMVKAARLIYRVDFDHHLFTVYRPRQASGVRLPRFTPQTLDNVRAWVRKRCTVEQPEEVTELFRHLVCSWLLPLGADLARSRNKKTAHDVTTPLQMLEKEIGADLSQFYYDQTISVRLYALADDPTNPMWDALFLALFEFNIRQRIHFAWMKDYFTNAPHLPATQRRMANPRFHGVPDKCPMIVEATRAYQVFYQQQLIGPADNLVHAVLSWLYFTGRDFTAFKGKSGRRAILLENQEDMVAIYDTFLNADSVVGGPPPPPPHAV